MAQQADWREQLRTFHLTGRGLEHWMPDGPLWPEAAGDAGENAGGAPAAGGLAREYVAVTEARRTVARAKVAERFAAQAARLRALLDETPRGRNAEEFGVEGGQFLKPEALGALRPPAAQRGALAPEREARIRAALATLEQWQQDAAAWPVAYLHTLSTDPEPYGAALQRQRQLLEGFGEARRAAETARLEADGHYDPRVHAARIAREDWQSATAEELEALPLVAVCDTARRLVDESLTAFARTLRSGLPVHVLVEFSPADYEPDLTATALAHPEAFVLQTSEASVEDLRNGLARMAASLRPGAAFCGGGASVREAALAARAGVFARFTSVAGALEPAAAGDASLTPAHAAVALGDFRPQIRVLPPEAHDGEQVEAAEYLARYGAEAPLAIPYVAVAGGRAVLTRELAWWCHERMIARRQIEMRDHTAAPAAAVPAPTEAPAATPATAPDQIEQARRQGAGEAVQRLVAALLGATPVQLAELPKAVAAPPAGAAAAVAAPAPEAAPAAESADPYVESYLCTSCNDCLKVNNRMFQYNADNQIYLADASKGTYAELVKAAEACPAKCIHPGAPRAGDATATPAIRARAAKLKG